MNLNTNLGLNRAGSVGTRKNGIASKTALVGFGGSSGTYTATGNWNHIFQNFAANGAQAITGNSAGQPLSFLRDTNGVSTGWGITTLSQFAGDLLGQNTLGLFPAARIHDCWSVPATTRTFTIVGLTAGHTYTLKILMSVDTAVGAGPFLGNIVVTGASGGNTTTGFDERGNTSTLINGVNGFTVIPTAGGVVTIALTINTGPCAISVLTITD